MNLHEIEREALHLSEEERAELAQKLLLSLDTPTEAEIAERKPEKTGRRPGQTTFNGIIAQQAARRRPHARGQLRT
jgi:hypothetical protein